MHPGGQCQVALSRCACTATILYSSPRRLMLFGVQRTVLSFTCVTHAVMPWICTTCTANGHAAPYHAWIESQTVGRLFLQSRAMGRVCRSCDSETVAASPNLRGRADGTHPRVHGACTACRRHVTRVHRSVRHPQGDAAAAHLRLCRMHGGSSGS